MIDVQYSLGNGTLKGFSDEECSFLLSNNAGSFYYHSERSRNGGWFVHDYGELFRVLAEIRTPSPRISTVIHSGSKVEIKRNGIREMFALSDGKNALVYKTNTPLDTDIILDVKNINDDRQWGRQYTIKVENGMTIVHFTKSTDAREDKTNGKQEYEFFIVLDKPARVIKRWEERVYADDIHDAASHSRLVFRAVRVWTASLIITASKNLQRALDAQKDAKAGQWLENEHALTSQALKNFCEQKEGSTTIKTAFPVQRQTRDEIIAAAALAQVNPHHARSILIQNARRIMNDGRLSENSASEIRIADGTGWLFKRCYELMHLFSSEEKEFLAEKIVDVIETLHERYTKDGFAWDNAMAAISGDPLSIDAQALRLATYRCAHAVTKNELYKEMESKLRSKVHDAFWNSEMIAQSMGNYAPHPRIILAAYIYPELFAKEEWSVCFTNLLKEAWLEWGGLKIKGDNKDDNKSFFWLNNIAALCFFRTDRALFRNHIQKIASASRHEMLWQGCLGMHGEWSNAAKLSSNGACDIKSTATFAELRDENQERTSLIR